MTGNLHVFHVFDEMSIMEYACLGLVVQLLYEKFFHYAIYHSKKLHAVLGSGLEDVLERCLKYRDRTLSTRDFGL